MTLEVRAADGRTWMVRRYINWARPDIAQGFEHDVAAGKRAGIAMLCVVAAMVIALVVWYASTDVYIPTWALLGFLTVVMLVPLNWAITRPWTILVDTHEPLATSGEHWAGTVRGALSSQREVNRIARHLEQYASPDDGGGVLRQFGPSTAEHS